eukprot:SAG31_NODE_31144_length_371_cov_1.448529_1_plen_64_part_10
MCQNIQGNGEIRLATGEVWPDIRSGACQTKKPIDWTIIECLQGKQGKGLLLVTMMLSCFSRPFV